MSNRMLTLMMGFVAVLILVVGGVFVAVLATSSGDDDSPANPDAPKGSPTAKPKSTVAGKICEGNSLITYGSDPASVLDPIQVRDEGTSEYIVEIFGGLVTLGLDLSVQPDIAEKWDISADRKTYTFRLRDNAVFHNGRRVTAQDFKYSLERAADPKNNSPTVTLYLGEIAGLKEKYNGKASDISGVKVIDERTLEIKLNQPIEYFLAELSYPVAYVVDKDQVDKDPRNWTKKPNGTGPFKLKEFTPADKIVIVKNERYHLGAPKLDEVIFTLAGGSILTRYENNEIHIGGVPAVELEAVKGGSSPLSKEYHPSPRMAVSYMAFNLKKAPFDDLKVRQAMAMSVDRENINNVLLYGTQRVADGILPPEMPGYNERISSYKYDPQKAKQLLSESKYAGKMPRIILTYAGTGGDAPDILQAIQAGWKETLGIDVELQASEYSAYLRELRRGTFQMFSAGWAADYPDPEDFLDKLFASDSLQNEQGYKNGDVDRLLLQARTEGDKTKRLQLYHQAEQMILDDAAIIPDFWPVEHALVKSCVKNWPDISMTVPKYRFLEIKKD